jgi:uncharacterized protein
MLNGRGLLFILLGVSAWLLNRRRKQPVMPRPPRPTAPYEEMVRCAHCGVHLPQSRAVGNSRQGYFCTEEHRLVGGSDRT